MLSGDGHLNCNLNIISSPSSGSVLLSPRTDSRGTRQGSGYVTVLEISTCICFPLTVGLLPLLESLWLTPPLSGQQVSLDYNRLIGGGEEEEIFIL